MFSKKQSQGSHIASYVQHNGRQSNPLDSYRSDKRQDCQKDSLKQTHNSKAEQPLLDSFLNEQLPQFTDKCSIIIARQANLEQPAYGHLVRKLEYYLQNIKIITKSIKQDDLLKLKDQKPSKELLFGGSALISYVAGSMKTVSQDLLYKKVWNNVKYNEEKISVYDYQAVKATETTFGKRLADLSYYYISFYEKFKELQSLNTKRSKSRGMVVTNNSSRGRIHKFNTTFNNDTANSSLENIEMFTYPTKEDITKQLKDLENSIRAKKESIRKIQQSFNYNTQTDRDSYRSLSQGEVVSDRAKTKSKRSTKNDEENQIRRIKEQFKRSNKTRYFISPNKEKHDSSRSFSLDFKHDSLHTKLLQAELQIKLSQHIKKENKSPFQRNHKTENRQMSSNGAIQNKQSLVRIPKQTQMMQATQRGPESGQKQTTKIRCKSPEPQKSDFLRRKLPIHHPKQQSINSEWSTKRLNKSEIMKEKSKPKSKKQ